MTFDFEWYTEQEIIEFLEHNGFPKNLPKFLSKHLNMAFKKGQQAAEAETRKKLIAEIRGIIDAHIKRVENSKTPIGMGKAVALMELDEEIADRLEKEN